MMRYKIVADSCCDLNDQLRSLPVEIAPLQITYDQKEFIDNASLDRDDLLTTMRNSPNPVRTACPSPEDYARAFEGADAVFVITLSANLSGSYNSAETARKMFLERFPDVFIHVFNSCSASAGESVICKKLGDLIKAGLSPEKITSKANQYIKSMHTYFILKSLDNLVKNGRIQKWQGHLASALSIKPIMCGDREGMIKLAEMVRGTKKAFKKLVEIIGRDAEIHSERIIGISHCNALEEALQLKEELAARYQFQDIIIMETSGLSSVYTNEGGVVVAY